MEKNIDDSQIPIHFGALSETTVFIWNPLRNGGRKSTKGPPEKGLSGKMIMGGKVLVF